MMPLANDREVVKSRQLITANALDFMVIFCNKCFPSGYRAMDQVIYKAGRKNNF